VTKSQAREPQQAACSSPRPTDLQRDAVLPAPEGRQEKAAEGGHAGLPVARGLAGGPAGSVKEFPFYLVAEPGRPVSLAPSRPSVSIDRVSSG
jgi:hypothetical protein